MKREAVYASIKSQLLGDPQRGTVLLLNILKLFADRKDDNEFVKELADLAGDLAAAMDLPYAQSPLLAQPMPMPVINSFMQGGGSIPVPSIADFPYGQPLQPPQPPQPPQPEQKEIATDAVSALNKMGQDTTAFQSEKRKNEPLIEGYEEYVPKKRKK